MIVIHRQTTIDFFLFNIFPKSEGAEYECPTDEQFQQKNGRLCMSLSLACDGLPNCGENIIPNADEACFKVTIQQSRIGVIFDEFSSFIILYSLGII